MLIIGRACIWMLQSDSEEEVCSMTKKDLELQIQKLNVYVDSLKAALREIQASSQSTHIINFIPNTDEQFMLDGNIVFDPEQALYKGRKVSMSEAVMFKAGKEVARRECDKQLSECADRVRESAAREAKLQQTVSELSQRIVDLQQFNDHVEQMADRRSDSELQAATTEISNLRKLNDDHESQIKDLTDKLNSSDAQLAELKASLVTSDVALQCDTGDVVTIYGVIHGGCENE